MEGKPDGTLLLDAKALYGTTLDGGTSSQGEVFKLTTTSRRSWTALDRECSLQLHRRQGRRKPYDKVILGKAGGYTRFMAPWVEKQRIWGKRQFSN